jgi:hypothetical protein
LRGDTLQDGTNETHLAIDRGEHNLAVSFAQSTASRLSSNVDNQAFDEVMAEYNEVQARGLKTFNAEIAMRRVGQGQRSCKFVAPSDSDFICDVELAAGRMGLRLFAFFDLVFVQQRYAVDHIPTEVLTQIKRRLGRLLRSKRIWPIHLYRMGRHVGEG